MKARLLPLLGLLLVTACKKEPPAPAPSPAPRPSAAEHFLGSAPDGKLHVYFFDVGQGDSALIVSPEGRTVLVDAGPASAVNHLVNRLPELLVTRLDLVVLTHPAADHYGALDAVQKVANPRRLLEPQLPGTPSEYDALLTAIGSRGVEIFSPAPNPSQPKELTRLPLGKGAELTVLWPRAPSEPLVPGEPAANSIVLRLTYGKTSVLFAGDARAETEAALLKGGAGLGSTLLKVGAHGADFATSEAFLQAVNPRAAILSVGAGNKLGMPAPSVLDRLKATNAHLFRTDEDGEVHAVSDGQQFVLTPQKLHPGEAPTTQYAFSPEAKNPTPAVPPPPVPAVAKPEPVKAVPVKAVSAKAEGDVDFSHFKKVAKAAPDDSDEHASHPGKRPAPAGEKYYASKNSQIFHKASCRTVKRISPQNLITYDSREEAMRERKPSDDCHP
ncbi:MAG: ComEC/Rec2 family competence protein [Hyalangium sp.]|uniref:ComEC/Rec2 family competence protein n=1 Tax=Hyalangium sp. TaxID=2028555 RepID=UPI003899A73A